MKEKYRIKDVVFTKCYLWDAYEGISYFWRADLHGKTISTLCKTKKECIEEARKELKKMNKCFK